MSRMRSCNLLLKVKLMQKGDQKRESHTWLAVSPRKVFYFTLWRPKFACKTKVEASVEKALTYEGPRSCEGKQAGKGFILIYGRKS